MNKDVFIVMTLLQAVRNVRTPPTTCMILLYMYTTILNITPLLKNKIQYINMKKVTSLIVQTQNATKKAKILVWIAIIIP